MEAESSTIALRSSSNGRVSGKNWKHTKAPTARAQMSKGRRTTFHERMEKEKKDKAIKLLQAELRAEKQDEIARRKQVTKERREAAEEKKRLEEDKARMGARKAARLRRKEGRSKKINQ